MKIENDILIIEEPVENEKLEEFVNIIKQENLKKITINNPQLDSLIIQAIACFGQDKEIECNDSFLSKIFKNIIYAEA